MQCQGYNESEIAAELQTKRSIISKDLKTIEDAIIQGQTTAVTWAVTSLIEHDTNMRGMDMTIRGVWEAANDHDHDRSRERIDICIRLFEMYAKKESFNVTNVMQARKAIIREQVEARLRAETASQSQQAKASQRAKEKANRELDSLLQKIGQAVG